MALGVVQGGRGRLFHQLLMSALDRAVPLAEMHPVPLAVHQDLDLDVPRIGEIPLEVHRRIAKGGGGLGSRRGQRGFHVVRRSHDPHPLSSASGACLDDQREPDLPRQPLGIVEIADRVAAPRQYRNPLRLRHPAGGCFVSHQPDAGGRGADEGDPTLFADLGEMRILSQKSVPGMDGLGAADLGGADDSVELQVALRSGRRADAHGFVGQLDVQGLGVRLREDGHRPDAKLSAGPDDPNGYFAAICDKNFRKH